MKLIPTTTEDVVDIVLAVERGMKTLSPANRAALTICLAEEIGAEIERHADVLLKTNRKNARLAYQVAHYLGNQHSPYGEWTMIYMGDTDYMSVRQALVMYFDSQRPKRKQCGG